MTRKRSDKANRKPKDSSVNGSTRKSLVIGRRELAIGLGLCLVTLAVYAEVIGHRFINLDDDIYIYENPMVTAGLTLKGVVWAFTTFHAANWHPLTWLSHMIDAQLFGLNPGLHLAINALFHALNSLLVFVFLRYTANYLWRSAIVRFVRDSSDARRISRVGS
jgi:hypothetical protein